MMRQPRLEIRPITARDAGALAQLHTDSWRSTYRGILRDEYLDGDIGRERRAHWQSRFQCPTSGQFGLLALCETVEVGFAFAFAGADARRGTLLDNLHVCPEWRGGGIGTRLLHAVAGHVMTHHPGEGLFLWVYELNARTRAFYERLGAQKVEQAEITAPDGRTVAEWLYAWPKIDVLHRATRS